MGRGLGLAVRERTAIPVCARGVQGFRGCDQVNPDHDEGERDDGREDHDGLRNPIAVRLLPEGQGLLFRAGGHKVLQSLPMGTIDTL